MSSGNKDSHRGWGRPKGVPGLVRTGLVFGLLAAGATPALGVADYEIRIINGAPTNERAGSTATPTALFELTQPGWPGGNECRLNGGAWTPCSFEYEARNLIPGTYSFEVRQTSATGQVTTDQWVWRVLSRPSPPQQLALVPYCRIPFGEFQSRSNDPSFDYYLGRYLWSMENQSGSEIKSFPNTESLPANVMGTRKELAYWPFWRGEIVSRTYLGTNNLGNPAYLQNTNWFTSESDNTWPVGQTIFETQGRSPSKAPEPTPGANDPRVSLESPYNNNGTPRTVGSYNPNAAAASMPSKYVPCLRLMPPVDVVNNGDGTLSARFGWVNLSGRTLKTGGPADLNTDTIGTTQVSSFTGTQEMPSAMPTVFPPHASGTWTYTFLNPGSDPVAPITWKAGESSASVYVRQAQVTSQPGAPPKSPFSYINATTPFVPAARPLTRPSGAVAPVPPVADTGGAVDTLTRLKVSSRVTSPRNRTVKPGQLIHFTSTLRNVGSVDAVNPRICDTIPVGMTFVSAPGREIKGKGRQICWTSSRLAAGAAVTGRMTLRANRTARRGSRTNTIRATAINSCTVTTFAEFFVGLGTGKSQNAFAPMAWAGGATSPLPEAAREQQVGSNAPGIAKLKVATRVVKPSSRKVTRGKTLSIRGTLTNTSTSDARNVRLCERIPVGMTVVKAPFFGKTSARTICWSRPELKAGETVTGVTVLRAAKNAKVGIRANRSTVSAINACPVTSRTTFRVRS